MFNIWTSNVEETVTVIEGAGSFFDLTLKEHSYDDESSRKLMKAIDGVSIKKGNYVETKFGSTDITNLSTGCKAGLLALQGDSSIYISFRGAGENVFEELLKIVRETGKDVYVYMPRVFGAYTFTTDTFTVNGVLYRDCEIGETLEEVFECV